jgi:hypothetical protein
MERAKSGSDRKSIEKPDRDYQQAGYVPERDDRDLEEQSEQGESREQASQSSQQKKGGQKSK